MYMYGAGRDCGRCSLSWVAYPIDSYPSHLAGLTSVVVALLTFSVRYNVGEVCFHTGPMSRLALG